MLRTLLFALFASLTLTATRAQVVYVDGDAAAGGDGSSWAAAFANLAEAIDSAAAGSELWIAAGTYTTPADSSFTIRKELSLYGGFAGDETDRGDADPGANETILSGDVNGDDPEGRFDAALTGDNNRVMAIVTPDGVNSIAVTVEGLTIRNGVIAEDIPEDENIVTPFSGGGIIAFARVSISDVNFVANRANFGSATALLGEESTGSVLNNVNSEGNYFSQFGLHFTLRANDVTYRNINYVGTPDSASAAVIDGLVSSGLTIDSCSFGEITAAGNVFGGAVTTLNVSDIRITNSSFSNTSGGFVGGVISLAHTNNNDPSRQGNAEEVVIDSCSFTNAIADEAGGAVFLQNINATISNSTFSEGRARLGSAVAVVTDDEEDTLEYAHVFRNNRFENGSAVVGGAIFYNGTRCDLDLSESTFTNNSAENGTVAFIGSGNSNATIRDTEFSNNGAGIIPAFRGSAVYFVTFGSEGTSDSLTIENSTFDGNITTREGGVVSGGTVFVNGPAGAKSYLGIRNSEFTANASQETANGAAIYAINGALIDIADSEFSNNVASGSGGVLYALQFTEEVPVIDPDSGDTTATVTEYPEDNTPEFRITRSLFLTNSAGDQGGVADLQVSNMTVTNSQFIGNGVTVGEGSGGAIILNGSNSAPIELESFFINNTFYDNNDGGRTGRDTLLGSAGNSIALFQAASENTLDVTIQNNIFFQLVAEEEALGIERGDNEGTINVTSLGGNFFNSAAQPDFPLTFVDGDFTDTEVVDTDLFEDPTLNDFETDFPNLDLIGGTDNPLVDGGTTGDLVPEVDYFSGERIGLPDIGAIEFESIRTSVAEPIERSGLRMSFFPNPTADVLNIVNEDASIQSFTVMVSDVQGRFLFGRRFDGAKNELDLRALPGGTYNLSLLINDKVYSQQVIKR